MLGIKVFDQHNLIKPFKLDIVRLIKTVRSIEEMYHARNPYHNAIHAADVTQAVHCYIRDTALRPMLNPFDSLCCLFAAMCHDADHPGVNQAFLEKIDNYLVKFYDSKSVLENHHWHVAFSIFDDTGLFNHFQKTEWVNLKKYIQNLILATDISQQTNYLNRFVNLVEEKRMDMRNNEEHRLLILQMALKCADICNPCRVWSVCCSWANLVCEEFFRQGDRERHLGYPIGVVNDRYNTTPIKIQIGFIEFLVRPLFHQWHNFIQSRVSRRMCDLIESNLTKWKSKLLQENEKNNHSFQKVLAFSTNEEISKSSSIQSSGTDDISEAGDEATETNNYNFGAQRNRRLSLPLVFEPDDKDFNQNIERDRSSCMLLQYRSVMKDNVFLVSASTTNVSARRSSDPIIKPSISFTSAKSDTIEHSDVEQDFF